MSVAASNPQNPPNETPVGRVFERISEVSSLPEVALRIIQLADDPNTGAEELLGAVRSDPTLAMRLMRTVNSSYYALNEKVGDLKQAVTLLGFNEVRNLALTAYVAREFRDGEGHGRYVRLGLWNHMVGTAMVARMMARACGAASPQDAYLAGLLHDFGFILIDQYFHKSFCRVVDAACEDVPVCAIEMQTLGFDHAELGQYVATRWNLPDRVTAAIGAHHVPEQYCGDYPEMVIIVALANFFCHLKDLTSLGVQYVQTPPTRLFSQIGLRKEHVALILQQLDEVLAAARDMALVQIR